MRSLIILIFLNLKLPSSTTFARPFKQVPFLAVHATTMESYLFIVNVLSIKHLKPNPVCYLLEMYTYHSLEAKNKLINAKSNREPGMEGAGEKSGLGFMFTSTTSVTLFSRIFLCRSV